MHGALEVADILVEIFAFCDVATLAVAACVSRPFYNHAMHAVWRRTLSLRSLLRMVPANL
jgi:hypothetical protein